MNTFGKKYFEYLKSVLNSELGILLKPAQNAAQGTSEIFRGLPICPWPVSVLLSRDKNKIFRVLSKQIAARYNRVRHMLSQESIPQHF